MSRKLLNTYIVQGIVLILGVVAMLKGAPPLEVLVWAGGLIAAAGGFYALGNGLEHLAGGKKTEGLAKLMEIEKETRTANKPGIIGGLVGSGLGGLLAKGLKKIL